MIDHAHPDPDITAGIAHIPARRPPSQHIDPRALRAWRVTGGFQAAAVLVVALGIAALLWRLEAAWYVVAVPLALGALGAFVSVWLIPTVRWRRWRYEVTEREVELQHGILVVTRTLIPMSRVQHVDTKQGPILRRYHLATVEVATAAGTQEIPALSIDVADALRNRIAELAGVAEDV